MANYVWDVRRVFVNKRLRRPIVRKSGKVVKYVKVPITVYRLFLFGDFALTKQFRCVPVVRSGVLSWSVTALTEPKRELWPMLKLRPEPERRPSWKKWASMKEAEFRGWLSRVLGPEQATQAFGGRRFFCGHYYEV